MSNCQAKPLGSHEIVACSGQFLLVRPVLLQDLELCYAGFCSRNGIPMERIESNLDAGEIFLVERSFNVISGLRAPLPVPLEVEAVATAARKHPRCNVFIENQSSCAIVPEAPVRLQNAKTMQEESRESKSSSKGVARQASIKSMETPLLQASEEVSEEEDKFRTLVPHRQAMKIPSNIFWRHSDEWGRDPLLQYRFLPFEHLKGTLGKGIRAVFLTFLFYGNIAAVVMPVVLVLVFAVCQDGVHAAVRADLLRRDAGQHHYLLDFIVAPSFFRFWSLDLEMQILQGAAVLYVFLVGATIAYCMVLRSIPRLKPFEPFFGYADHAIRCVTYVLISAFILFVTNTLMWVVLGSLIRPADLLPYAIMVGMAATVTQSMLTKFKGMQQFCSSKMVSLLDKALLAIFKVMAKDLKGRNGFLQEEHEAFQKLQIDVWQKLREIEEAEEKQMASMVRKAHTSDKAEEFLRSIRLTSDAPVPRKGSSMLQVQDRTDGLAQDKEKQVKNLSKSLSLHSDTVKLIMNCFDSSVVMKRLESDSAANSNSS
ncbi:unnamed protein product, partial [Durusdinium trenchii]